MHNRKAVLGFAVETKKRPIPRPISSSSKPAKRLLLEKEEQRNECALTF